MASQTKAEILRHHQNNTDLNTPIPAQVMRGQNDLSADGYIRPLDERIIAATAEALESGQTHYVDVPGIGPLREAVADFLGTACAATYQPGNIVVTAGMQEARFLSIQMIGAQFDNIGVPTVAHPGVRKALGTRARSVISLPVDAQAGYLPSPASISDALDGGCQLLYLESPSRLSGAVYSAEQVAEINRALARHDAAAIWDQGLAVWVDGEYASLAAHDSKAERIAAIGEAFPGQGLASWFIGYIAAPEAWVPPMQSQKQIMSICTSTASQYAALEASQLYASEGVPQLASLCQMRAGAMQLATASGLDVVSGAACNIIALRAKDGAEAALAKFSAAGYDAADGAYFGAPDVIRLTVSAATADALRALA